MDQEMFLMLGLYFLPAFFACINSHRSPAAVFAANLLFGWTVIGWAIVLVWSLTSSTEAKA